MSAWKPPMKTTTITRADGTTTEVEHVDHAALLDAWDSLDNELWMLDTGDVHAIVDEARARLDAVLALCDEAEGRNETHGQSFVIAETIRRAASPLPKKEN